MFYLYVYCNDMTGHHVKVNNKPFKDENAAIDQAKNYHDIPGNHCIVTDENNRIIYQN